MTGFGTFLSLSSLTPLLSVAMLFALACVGLALLMTGWRLLRGPSLPDRVVALDLMTALLVALFLLLALASGSDLAVDVALTLALVGFLGTVAFARFIERGGRREYRGGRPEATSSHEVQQKDSQP